MKKTAILERATRATALLLSISGLAALWGCAKDPASTDLPYDGYVGTGPDWNADVAHVNLTVYPDRTGRAISPRIYGFNAAGDPQNSGLGALRQGGDRYTAYNWENNASNAGSDYMFQSDGFLVTGSPTPDAPGDAVRPMLEQARALGVAAVVTIPIVDYVAADKLADGDVRSSANYLVDRFRRNMPTKSSAFTDPPDPTDAFVYQDEFASWVKSSYGDADVLFSLDNEPDLWSQTHKEIHPDPLTYAELVQRNVTFAGAIKSVWPAAPVLGFVSYGWNGYLTLQNAPDAGKNGDFVSYYLAQMKAAQETAGSRLIDFLDLHWYPEAVGTGAAGTPVRITAADTSPGVIDARVAAPRSFWDPGYRESSWIVSSVGGAIALIPAHEAEDRGGIPRDDLVIHRVEFWGRQPHQRGVAAADVLGIFGREGVGLATYWPTGNSGFVTAAIRAYRNYDGAGARFGDTDVRAETSSIASSSVYGSIDSTSAGRTVIIAINKRQAPTTATLKIAGTGPAAQASAASVWVLSGDVATLTEAPPLAAAAPGSFDIEMPPLSVNVIVPQTAP